MPRGRQAKKPGIISGPWKWDEKKPFTRDNAVTWIRERLQEGWNPVDATGPGFSAIYRRINRRNFFGYKGWPDFLEKAVGVVPLRRVGDFLVPHHQTPESIHAFIKARAEAGESMGVGHWTGRPGLMAVWRFLDRRNFFGHGNWENYLNHEFGYSLPQERQIGQFVIPKKLTKDVVVRFVRERAADTSLRKGVWNAVAGLKAVYNFIRQNKYFGHGNWAKFLEKEIGALPVEYGVAFRKRKKILEEIKQLAQTEPMTTTHWEWGPDKHLSNLYSYLQRHRFFGYGTWTNFLEKEIGLRAMKQSGAYFMPVALSKKFVESFIRRRARDTPMDRVTWQSTGLMRVYRFAENRKFFGNKDWAGYIGKLLAKT